MRHFSGAFARASARVAKILRKPGVVDAKKVARVVLEEIGYPKRARYALFEADQARNARLQKKKRFRQK